MSETPSGEGRKLLLFDIDGTLLRPLKGHGRALGCAIRAIYGVAPHVEGYVYAGATDCMIMGDLARLQGVEAAVVEAGMPRCVEYAVQVFERAMPQVQVEVLPGIRDALAQLHRSGHVLGLVTGNLEPIAHLKLKAAGLDHYFELGGFGSDHVDRAEMVRIAVARAEERCAAVPRSEVWLVGDTPRDIRAGKSAGVRTVAVTSGHFGADELRPENPDLLLASAADLVEPCYGIVA